MRSRVDGPTPGRRGLGSRWLLAVAALAWVAFWFWAFSFSFSDGFFRYHRHTRLPHFAAALLCVVVLPGSALATWRRVAARRSSALGGLLRHGFVTVAALALPLGLTVAFARAEEAPWRLEADEAMGAGIVNLAVLVVALAVLAVLVAALLARRRRMGSAAEP